MLTALAGLSLVTAIHILLSYYGRGIRVSVREALFSGVATWYAWALLAPLVFQLCRRFPFEAATWRRSFLVHVPASLACGGLYSLARWAASYVPWVDARPSPYLFWFVSHFYVWFLSYWLLVGLDQARHNYQRFRERELRASQLEAKLAQAQLEVLKIQLHPHFLFNTLHAISTLIHKDPDAADEMVAQLSDLLRMTLASIGVQEVPLRQEMEFLQRYLDLQQMRFQDRLHVDLDVPRDLLDSQVPNQILQPLVENAIRHGVDARSERGVIAIGARATEHTLFLTVRDDGPGIDRQAMADSVRDGRGIGLANTRARLRELYGPASTLQLANHPEGGTLVTLSIPLRRAAPLGSERSRIAS